MCGTGSLCPEAPPATLVLHLLSPRPPFLPLSFVFRRGIPADHVEYTPIAGAVTFSPAFHTRTIRLAATFSGLLRVYLCFFLLVFSFSLPPSPSSVVGVSLITIW